MDTKIFWDVFRDTGDPLCWLLTRIAPAENKKKEQKTEMASQQQTIAVAEEDKQLSVVLESLPVVYNVDKSRLIEIKDSSVLARIDALIPSAGAAGVSIGNIAGQ